MTKQEILIAQGNTYLYMAQIFDLRGYNHEAMGCIEQAEQCFYMANLGTRQPLRLVA